MGLAESLTRGLTLLTTRAGSGLEEVPLVAVPLTGLDSLIRNMADLDGGWILADPGGGSGDNALPNTRRLC